MPKTYRTRCKENRNRLNKRVAEMVDNHEIGFQDAFEISKLPKNEQLKYAKAAKLMRDLRCRNAEGVGV